MSHLSPERLAALADDEPTAAEATHLAACAACARERRAAIALASLAAAERGATSLPLTRWDALAEQLRSEGVLPARRRTSHRWLQAAAAVLVAVGGALVGRATAPGARPVASPTAAADPTAGLPASFTSRAEALAFIAKYEAAYRAASALLVERDSAAGAPTTPDAYRARLAALDQVAATTQAALRDAPYDPVINSYYLTALGAREATLRQLSTSLPEGYRMDSF
ncbi:MAG TPA: hypothetical protein VNA89_02360 [Gemmatimonadaceae bacterium]|nr:hypothetical protein [Gemmatimonadaceae bacterium]